MRRTIAVVVGIVYAVTLAVPLGAADMTIKGTVVCFPFPKEPEKPAATPAEALACAKKGLPVGVRTADTVFMVMGDYTASNNTKLLDFVARIVLATGEIGDQDGWKVINVKSIKLAPADEGR